MHYYEFNIKDYRAKTAHLSPTEHYVYRSLIDWYYLNEKPFPCDLEKIARLLMLPTNELQSLQNVLDEFFVIKKLKGDPCECYHHRRIDKEVVNYKHNKRGKSTNTTNTTSQTTNESTNNLQTTTNATTNQGTNKNTTDSKKAVFIEALKNQGVKANTRMTIGELQALFDKHCGKLQMTTNETTNATNAISPPNNHKPLTNNHKPLTNINNTHTQTSEEKNSPLENQPQSEKTKKTPKSEIDSVIVMDWFNQFWEKYPNKISKGQASKTWMKLFLGDSTAKATESPHQLFEQIITGLERNSEYIKNQANRGYVKHASTWLNASGWLDEVTTVQPITQNLRLPKFGSKDDPLAVNQHWGQPSYVEPNTTPEEWLEMQQAKMKARDLASNRQSQPTGMITL